MIDKMIKTTFIMCIASGMVMWSYIAITKYHEIDRPVGANTQTVKGDLPDPSKMSEWTKEEWESITPIGDTGIIDNCEKCPTEEGYYFCGEYFASYYFESVDRVYHECCRYGHAVQCKDMPVLSCNGSICKCVENCHD